MRVSIGSDHAGFEQKQALVDYLVGKGYDVIDRGPDNDDRVDYPDYAAPWPTMWPMAPPSAACSCAARASAWPWPADKVPGVRAANIINSEFAALCREHNDANVITLSGRFVPLEENERILDTFFTTDFGGGRHAGRVEKIMALD